MLTALGAYAVIPECVLMCEEANGTVMTITLIPEGDGNEIDSHRMSAGRLTRSVSASLRV